MPSVGVDCLGSEQHIHWSIQRICREHSPFQIRSSGEHRRQNSGILASRLQSQVNADAWEAQAPWRAAAVMRSISSSQVAGLLSAVIVLIVIVAIGFLLQPLQKVILFSGEATSLSLGC